MSVANGAHRLPFRLAFAITQIYGEHRRKAVYARRRYVHLYMWRHLKKTGLWRSIQCFPRSAFSIYLYSSIIFELCRMGGNVFCRDSYVTKSPDSDQTPRRTRGVWSEPVFCPSISQVFQDDGTYKFVFNPRNKVETFVFTVVAEADDTLTVDDVTSGIRHADANHVDLRDFDCRCRDRRSSCRR